VSLESQFHEVREISHQHQLLQELGKWRRKKEVLRAQRAKANFLKYGDSNTRWFHARASMRKTTNAISKLERADGTMARISTSLSR